MVRSALSAIILRRFSPRLVFAWRATRPVGARPKQEARRLNAAYHALYAREKLTHN